MKFDGQQEDEKQRTKLKLQHLGLRCTCMLFLFVFQKQPYAISISLLAHGQECNNYHSHSFSQKRIFCKLDVNVAQSDPMAHSVRK